MTAITITGHVHQVEDEHGIPRFCEKCRERGAKLAEAEETCILHLRFEEERGLLLDFAEFCEARRAQEAGR